jgi:hypothetical protein
MLHVSIRSVVEIVAAVYVVAIVVPVVVRALIS